MRGRDAIDGPRFPARRGRDKLGSMRRLTLTTLVVAAAAACSGRVGGAVVSADAGTAADTRVDVEPDAAIEARPDATPGAQPDAAIEAHADATSAAGVDAEVPRADASPAPDAAPDAAVTASDAAVAARGCAGSTYRLCEDFEGTAEGAVPSGWRRVMPYTPEPGAADATEVFVASDQPHWGARSLKSTSRDCAQTRIEHPLAALGATAGRHWGRAYFYVQTPAPMSNRNGGWYHTTMVALRGDNAGGGSARECRVVDMVENAFDQSVAFLYNVPDDSCCDATPVTPYTFRYESVWHCAEWYVDASTRSWRFFLDGTELLAFSGVAGARLEQCDVSLAVGALCYAPPLNAPQDFTAWIDDVAIDDARIGCP